jgi:alkylresorcinol/alkylpyrone synthase
MNLERRLKAVGAPPVSDGAPVLLAVGTALPPNVVDQPSLAALLRSLWSEEYSGSRRWQATFDQVHRTVRIDRRYLALPVSEYGALDSFAKTNAAWTRVAPELGAVAVLDALNGAGLGVRDIDHLFFITGTGIATPSIDARLVNRLGMRPDIQRTPIFGLGCAGGLAGLGRAADYVRAYPDRIALVVSVELCSLTLQRRDLSIANVIAASLFGDGAAATVVAGAEIAAGRTGGAPRVIAMSSVLYPDTERMMGWDVVDSGFKIVLSPTIPDLVREHVGGDVDDFLAAHGLERRAISHWIAHTGGNRVLEALDTALDLAPGALERSWRLLGATGNLSSASVLFVLRDLLDSRDTRPGDWGVMLALGPGFCAELVLLQW